MTIFTVSALAAGHFYVGQRLHGSMDSTGPMVVRRVDGATVYMSQERWYERITHWLYMKLFALRERILWRVVK